MCACYLILPGNYRRGVSGPGGTAQLHLTMAVGNPGRSTVTVNGHPAAPDANHSSLLERGVEDGGHQVLVTAMVSTAQL